MQRETLREALIEDLIQTGPKGLSRESAADLADVVLGRQDRYSSDELLRLAQSVDATFTRRLLADWPKWGLLALATTTGRGPSGGVERSWSPEQASVFVMVVRTRVAGHTRRADLANVAVFLWLLLGPSYVPHDQARRALATWTKAARNLSAHRAVTDNYHAVLRSPRVQERLTDGSLRKPELLARSRAAPTIADITGLALYLGSYGKPNGSGSPEDEEIDEMTRRHTRSLEALQRGMHELPTAPDSMLAAVRERYLASCNIDFLRTETADPVQIDAAVASRRFRTESETACSNALAFLGTILNENDRPVSGLERLLGSEPIRKLTADLTDGLRKASQFLDELLGANTRSNK
jgi:hypothetical protein